jgi:phosphomannomutase
LYCAALILAVVVLQVYWGNGCQIIPPHDAGIAAAIEENLALWEVPEQLPQRLVYDPTQQIADSYYSKLKQHLQFCSDADNGQAAPVVYTPLHGVGGQCVLQAFKVSLCHQ